MTNPTGQVDSSRLAAANTRLHERIITAPLLDWKEKIKAATRYIRAYRNYPGVLAGVVLRNFPISGILRDGTRITLHDLVEARVYSFPSQERVQGRAYVERILAYEEGNLEFLYVTSVGRFKLRLRGLDTNGDPTVFFTDQYHQLPVRGGIVIDVGANVADSAIYFACKGARLVLAFEPVPSAFSTALENVSINEMARVVKVVQQAVGGQPGNIALDARASGHLWSQLATSANGVQTRVTTLEEICQEYAVDEAVLKMDCEGYEYEILFSSRKDVLRKFSHILIEYHFGHQGLSRKLKSAGFAVEHTPPRLLRPPLPGLSRMYMGYLSAVRRPESRLSR